MAASPRRGFPEVEIQENWSLQSLSTQLDLHLLRLFVELEELEGKREALNARVEEGWFSLSKTRYAMGAKAVSSLQYASSMVPLFRVCISELESGRPEFQVVFTDPKEVQDVTDNEEPKSEAPLTPVLRRRPQPHPQPHGSPLQSTSPTPAPLASLDRDPLTWFGILVPQSLRQAQGSFRGALLIAGEIAELQGRIEWCRTQVQALQKEKQKLLEQLKV
ncbi:coiled-coil domain-containing protein 115-like [Gracilinanus agilis]|uniref:coiled-coil domain-containing protein 115-like n=1 Tax=Gracilinanus agilis TaxID=191870 RepID=UPI001CFC6DB7|nr:coiled-coil domain-containing protein 115-like [Gracilinanus agilis]